MDRCMSDGNVLAESESREQVIAICSDIWKRERGKAMSINERLLSAIKARTQKQTEFGYGIITADKYVRTIQEAAGLDCCYKYASTGNTSFADVLQKASNTLVYSNSDMEISDVLDTAKSIKAEVPTANVELPKNTLIAFKHVLTTPRKDRDGDILRTEGAVVDPKMLLLWQHVHTLPIGKMLGVVSHDQKQLVLVSAIVDMNELSHDAAVMVDNGMARFSHGFRALEFEELKSEEDETTSPGGFDVKKFEIMEESLVSVPSNVDAETQEVLLDMVESGKLTSDLMKEVGKTIRAKRPVSANIPVDVKGLDDEDVPRSGGEAAKGSGSGTSTPKETEAISDQTAETKVAEDPQVASKRAVLYKRTPASSRTVWDSDAAVGRLRDWAGVNEDDPSEGAWEKYAQGFARVVGDGNKLGDFSLPHHDIEDGRLVVVRRGVSAAIAAVNGARGEIKFESDAEKRAIYDHLTRHLTDTFDVPDEDVPDLKDVKAGRALSQRTLEVLKTVHDDLLEIAENESLSRAARALIDRCVNALERLMGNVDDADAEANDGKQLERAVDVILAASPDDRAKLAQLLDGLRQIEDSRKKGEQFRKAFLRDHEGGAKWSR